MKKQKYVTPDCKTVPVRMQNIVCTSMLKLSSTLLGIDGPWDENASEMEW